MRRPLGSDHVPSEYDSGKAALDALIEWADANITERSRNEATTRLHVVDVLVNDVLRWRRAEMQAEEPAGSGRIDYSLGRPATLLIVEAKREGQYFSLPAGTRTGVHGIDSLVSGAEGRSLRDALEQVMRYASHKGVGPAAITNGHQLVVFLAARTDGIPPLAGHALVFPSIEDMSSGFRKLWDNLSRAGLEQRTLYQTLRSVQVRAPEPLSAHLPNYPGTRRRNSLQAGLDILAELFLEDVARLEELRFDFLRDCYAGSGALSQYAEISKRILQTRYALLNKEGGERLTPATGKKGIAPELTQDMLAAAASRRPIVLLGDVGVGKTTFIQRLVHVDAREIFAASYTIYIDFGSTVTLGRLGSFVVEEGIRQLWERYDLDIEDADFVEAVHGPSLRAFDQGVMGRMKDVDQVTYERERIGFLQRKVGDRPAHLKASLEYLRSTRKRQVVVFLDNIDQRGSEDQEQVFLIANELASTWPATVFVTLRPETFYKSSRAGVLSGYQPRVFTISPPRCDIMLQRRVDFALRQIKETGRLGSYPMGVTVDSASLAGFLEILSDNFRRNGPLLRLVDNVAGGNMRMALKFVTDFIGSGHVNTQRMLDVYENQGEYTIPVHEFLRALLYGDGEYYDPESSPIANLMNISYPDGREHFLLPLLLAYAQTAGERLRDEGYVAVNELFTFAQHLGFEPDQISSALDRAVRSRLVDAAPKYGEQGHSLYYRITTVGAYTT